MVARWGPWQLTNNGDALTLDPSGRGLDRDWIDLTRCTTAAETLDAIIHASRNAPGDNGEHREHDDSYIAGLVRALDDMLDPIANLCSGGQPKTLSARRLRQILDAGGAR